MSSHEWSILFAGPVGAGKTQAIRSLSDIDVLDTEARATDDVALMKSRTTVAMDVGVLRLGGDARIRLLGSPGQARFDFMWDILLDQARGLAVLVDHSLTGAVDDLSYYADQMAARMGSRWVPWVVGVTHAESAAARELEVYRSALAQRPGPRGLGPVPVLQVDARRPGDVRRLVLTLAAMMEMVDRFPVRVGEGLPA